MAAMMWIKEYDSASSNAISGLTQVPANRMILRSLEEPLYPERL